MVLGLRGSALPRLKSGQFFSETPLPKRVGSRTEQRVAEIIQAIGIRSPGLLFVVRKSLTASFVFTVTSFMPTPPLVNIYSKDLTPLVLLLEIKMLARRQTK